MCIRDRLEVVDEALRAASAGTARKLVILPKSPRSRLTWGGTSRSERERKRRNRLSDHSLAAGSATDGRRVVNGRDNSGGGRLEPEGTLPRGPDHSLRKSAGRDPDVAGGRASAGLLDGGAGFQPRAGARIGAPGREEPRKTRNTRKQPAMTSPKRRTARDGLRPRGPCRPFSCVSCLSWLASSGGSCTRAGAAWGFAEMRWTAIRAGGRVDA